MNESQFKSDNLLDTTDCLEAIGVFRCWKNFLFVIAVCCLLALQVSFWLVNSGHIKADDNVKDASAAVIADDAEPIARRAGALSPIARRDASQRADANEEPATDPNQPLEPELAKPQPTQDTQVQETSPGFGIKFKQLTFFMRFFNFVLIIAAVLYCLTILFALKVSLLGRLGGINHISRAFFISLTFVVLLLPWQRFFPGVVAGAMYTPQELLASCTAVKDGGIFTAALHYLRFTGYWLLVLLLLTLAQLRSCRWSKAILRRLEVI